MTSKQWRQCDVEWNYIHDSSVAIVMASLKNDEGDTLAYNVIAVMHRRGNKVILDIFREECRPKDEMNFRVLRDYQDAMLYIHDNCLIEISKFMETRLP